MIKSQILCVDDEPLVLSALERTLGRDSWRVIAVADGREALDLLDRPSIKVVVADQRMPRMLGSELLEETRKRRPDVGRIILTAYPGPDVMVRGLEAHVDFLIAKPWNEDQLRRAVRRLIGEVDRARAREAERPGEAWRDLGGEGG